LFENFIRESDYTIDMHSALDGGTIAPFTYVLPDDDKNGTLEIREKCAWAYGSPYIYYHTRGVKFGTTVATTSLPLEADNVSAPLMLAEMGESRRVSPEYIDLGVRGIQNVAKAMGILKGEPDIRVPQRKFHHFAIAHSDHGGGLKMVVEPQDEVTVGQPLAEVYDIFGDRVEVVESPADGFVPRVLKFGTISTGGEVAWIGH
jgi:predicted deacylase